MKRFEKEKNDKFDKNVILTDRCVLEYFEIFVKNLFDSGLMSEEDHKVYKFLYDKIVEELNHPDLIIFLKSDLDTNLERIRKRNRECESKIDLGYLKNLHVRYENFLSLIKKDYSGIQVLEVDTDDLKEDEVFELVLEGLKKNNEEIFFN